MSTTIDEKVVEMRFDNKQFESNVQTSLSTLDKLKKGLNLSESAKGLESVGKAANGIDMSGLSGAVETVRARFSALEVMALTALANITNSAINAGKHLVSAFTIDPVKSGFEEYETQINAVQTILANTESKGSTLKDVNAALDELNTYADKTIYNFTEMTRNIGTFTAAGVDLDTSVSAIKGIANLAAVSGSTSQQASTAMYQLSQALASGTVKLQDWNSVVNAGMGGQVFQDALKETARVHGIAIDDMIEKEGSFRETLQKGWLTSDILTETLSKFTGDLNEEQLKTMGYSEEQIASIIKMGKTANDAATKVKTFTQLFDTLKEAAQSGWTQSWEIIIGDFEEAKSLLTKVSKVFEGMIGDSANARNAMLQEWKDLGGRTAMIDAFRNAFESVKSVVTPVKEAFREIFPPMTGKRLADITEKIRDLTEKFKIGDKTSQNLKSTFKGVFAILDIVKQAFSATFKAVSPLFGAFDNLGGGLLGVTAFIGDWIVKLDEAIKAGDVFNNVLQGLVGFVKMITAPFKNLIQMVSEKFKFSGLELFHGLLERVHDRMSQVGEAAGSMKSGVTGAIDAMGSALANSKFLQALQAVWEGVKIISSGIADALGGLMDSLIEKLGNADFNGILDLINSLSLGGIALAIGKFLKSATKPFEGLQDIAEGVTNILDGVRGCFEAYQTQLKAGTLLKIASAIGILAAAIVAISLIDSDKLNMSLGAITVMFADLMAAMAIFSKISGDTKGAVKSSTTMIAMSTSVLILASALKKIADLDINQLEVGMLGVAGLTAIMVSAAKVMGSGSKTVIKGATSMVIFAAAIKVLASVCKELSELSWDELATGLTSVGVLLAEVSLFLNTAKFSLKAITTATGMVILAGAIKILASACKDFKQMKWDEIGRGLTSIGALLLEVAAFTRLTGNAKHVISTGVALIAIAAAMKIFASAAKDMAKLTWDQIARGISGMAGALLAITIALNLMPKNMIGMGTGLVVVSSALLIMSEALGKMSGMTWDEIAKGLTALGGAITILAVGLKVMTGTLAGSAALVVAVGALAMLAPIISILGAMSWEGIAKGLISIAGAFAVIGVAGLILSPLIPTILGLAGAFALIGVSVLGIGAGLLAAGVGLSAMAVGFTALAAAGVAGATAIVASLTVIITGIAGLIPVIAIKIGEGIIAFFKVIAEGAPEIAEAVKAVILSMVDVLVECAPALADGGLELISSVLSSLAKYTPQIVDSLVDILVGIMEGIANNMPKLIKAAIDVLMSFFESVTNALSGIDTGALLKGIVGIGLLSGIMIALGAVASLVPGAMVGVLGMGAVIAELALVLAAIGALAQIPGLSWLIDEGGKLLEGIGTAIGSFVGGIVGGFMSGVSSQFPQIGSDLSAFMTNLQPFLEGASRIDSSVMDGVKALGETILMLTAADVLQGLTAWFTGGSSIVDFGAKLAEFGPYFNSYYESIKGIDGSVVQASANAAKSLAEMANNLPNQGGVASWFAGENTLSKFCQELTTLGPSLKQYADSIQGLDPAVAVNSANAAKALAEMANNLPNSGGLVSIFTGSNDMGAFGTGLVAFGRSFSQYSSYMNNVNTGIVTATTSAAKSIVELQKSLPKEGGLFSNDMTLSSFGSNLASFGLYFGNYYNYVSGVNTSQLAAVIAETNSLVSMARGMSGLDTSGVSGFARALTALGESGVNGFIKAFTGAKTRVTKAVSDMVSAVTTGVNAKKKNVTTAMSNLLRDAVTSVNSKQKSAYTNAGQALMTNLISGLKSKSPAVSSALSQIVSTAQASIRNKYYSFYSAGSYLVSGFASGISANTYLATAKAKAMASAAANAAKEALDINSPSKVFYTIGDYAGQGFVNALDDYGVRSYKVGSEIAESARNGLSKAISKVADVVNGKFDAQPTIRPVLDLSAVQSGAGTISDLLSTKQSIGVMANVDAISSMMNANQNGNNDDIISAINSLRKSIGTSSGDTYVVNGITYDDGSNIADTVKSLIRVARVERRV